MLGEKTGGGSKHSELRSRATCVLLNPCSRGIVPRTRSGELKGEVAEKRDVRRVFLGSRASEFPPMTFLGSWERSTRNWG